MSTDIFRKYIDIINEAQDFSSQAKALRQRRIDTIREWVYQEIEEIYKGAATKGWDMTDNIADELGDHFAQVQRSGDPVLQRAYEMVRELSDSTPEEQAAGALKAMKMLKGQVDKESQNNGNGVGPFKIYVENHFIDQFPTLEEAESEVDFLRKSDPKSATHNWRIVDSTGKTVWEYDFGDDIDAARRD
jgi:hypothetical protein